MGVPVNLIAAVTPNDIVHRTFTTGDFSLSEKVLQTWATAMDIQVKIRNYLKQMIEKYFRFPTMSRGSS